MLVLAVNVNADRSLLVPTDNIRKKCTEAKRFECRDGSHYIFQPRDMSALLVIYLPRGYFATQRPDYYIPHHAIVYLVQLKFYPLRVSTI
jgi:hypothetical protein